VSIADTSGKLLFYAHSRATIAGFTGLVFDSTHQIMQNGTLVQGQGWYNEMIIIPVPLNDQLYYLFSIGVNNSSTPGLFYSVIDMSMNNGLGAVTMKNIPLATTNSVDCLSAVKHGNGQDWWLIYRNMDINFAGNKRYYKYLINNNGINFISSQAIGTLNTTNGGNISFNKQGTKMVFTNLKGLIDVMNFNRCTGHLSQVKTIEIEKYPAPLFTGSTFSPNSNYLYVSCFNDTSYLFKYDLTLSNPASNRDTIWIFNDSPQSGGYLRLAPDDKIYLSNAWFNGWQWNYPYQDTAYNYVNMNLSVINDPDQPGFACNFQPYSFNLGGKRTYWGLPNNPDYELEALTGSPCDTLVGIAEQPAGTLAELYVYYSPDLQTAFINAQKLTGKNYLLRVYDLSGHEVFKETGSLISSFFTKNLNCSTFTAGMYVVVFQTDKEKLVKKVVFYGNDQNRN
jgi:hypothetical protein